MGYRLKHRKTEAGHSNSMAAGDHRDRRITRKVESRKARRHLDAAEALRGIWSWMTDKQYRMICRETDRGIL